MPLYAHTETDYALDVHEHPDMAGYRTWANLVPGSNTWVIEEVPAGTVHGALRVDGEWVNPPPPLPAVAPAPSATPTKDELLAQMAALTAQLAALP